MRRKSVVRTTRTLVVKPLSLALWPGRSVYKLTVNSGTTQDLTPEMFSMHLAEIIQIPNIYLQCKMFNRFPDFSRKRSRLFFFPLAKIQSLAESRVLLRRDSMALSFRIKLEDGENNSPAELHFSMTAFFTSWTEINSIIVS